MFRYWPFSLTKTILQNKKLLKKNIIKIFSEINNGTKTVYFYSIQCYMLFRRFYLYVL